jgi:hypothetical protein
LWRHQVRGEQHRDHGALPLLDVPQGARRGVRHVCEWAESDFRFVKGKDLVARYESTPGSFRAFCKVCGSDAPTFSSDGKSVYIPAGMLDDDPVVRPSFHMYVGSRAPWWIPGDALPKYVEWPVDDTS